jgi:hypothetical protein
MAEEDRVFPLAVLRVDIGNPRGVPDPSSASYRALFAPGRHTGVLGYWEAVTYGYYELSGSKVFTRRLHIPIADVLGPLGRRPDRTIAYTVQEREFIGNRVCELAGAAGIDLSPFRGLVIVLRQQATYRRRPVDQYGAGAAETSSGLPFCVFPVTGSHSIMAHEVGHVLGWAHSWGLLNGSSWRPKPFDMTRVYGDPFCVMSADTYGGQNPRFGQAAPAGSDWPAGTYAASGCGPALATVRRNRPEVLQRNSCVRRVSSGRWSEGLGTVRLHVASLPGAGLTKLLVLDEPASAPGDASGTWYIEYRAQDGWDRGLVPDAAFERLTVPAVVVHQVRRERECVPDSDETGHLPECTVQRRRGRSQDFGEQARFIARIPVPPPLSPDWHAPGAPYLRVDGWAPDGSWVDLYVGAPVAAGYRALLPLELPAAVERSRRMVASGQEDVRVPCVPQSQRFSWTLDEVSQELTLTARVRGYGRGTGPTGKGQMLTWTIGGHTVEAPAAGEPAATGRVSIPVDVQRFGPGPRPATIRGWDVTVEYEATGDGRLVLRNSPADGNYGIQVEAMAVDASGSRASQRQQRRPVLFQGHALRWEEGYHRLLDGCLDELTEKFRDLQFEPPEFPPPRRPRPDPVPSRLATLARAHARLTPDDPPRAAEIRRLAEMRYGVDLAGGTA